MADDWAPKTSGARKPTPPARSLLRLAGRLSQTTGTQQAHIAGRLGKSLQGFTPEQVVRIGTKAKLPPDQLLNLQHVAAQQIHSQRVGEYLSSQQRQAAKLSVPAVPAGDILNALAAPGRAGLSFVAEAGRQGEKKPVNIGPVSLRFLPTSNPLRPFKAAAEGFVGKRHDTPASIAAEAGAARQRQGVSTKTFGGLPGTNLTKGQALPGGKAGRLIYETGGSIAADPTTYLTFGTTAGAEAAARSAAPLIAEARGGITAAEAAKIAETGVVTGNQAVRDVLSGLREKGLGSLSKAEKAALPPGLVRELRGVRGGTKVAGHTVPGTELRRVTAPLHAAVGRATLNQTGHVGRVLGKSEELTRTFAGVRQLERAGEVPYGTTQDVRNAFARFSASAERGSYATEMSARASRGLTPAELARVNDAMDIGGPKLVAGLTAKEKTAYDAFSRIRQNTEDIQNVPGILHTGIPTNEYQARFAAQTTPKATRGRPLSGTQAGNLMPRAAETRFTPLSKIRDEQGNLKYIQHPGIITARRAQLAERDVARTNLVSDLRGLSDSAHVPFIKTEGITDAELAAAKAGQGGYRVKELPVTTTDENGAITTVKQNVLVNETISRDFDQVVKLLTEDSAQKWVRDNYDKALGLWKSYATTFGPFGGGFALRNAQGNLINGFYLTGINPRFLRPAARLQSALTKGVRQGDMFKYLSGADATAVRDAIDHGVLNAGFFHDLGNPTAFDRGSLLGRVGRGVNPLSTRNVLLSKGHQFNSWIEQNARLGLFLGERAKGISAAEAARIVRKYLFDYSELSSADRAIKEISPFFTWTRKNVPLQLETLLKQPGKITQQVHALQGAQSQAVPFDPRSLADWQRQSDAVVLPFKVGGRPSALIPDTPLTSTYDTVRAAAGLKNLFGGPGQQDEARNLINALGVGGPAAGLATGLLQVGTGRQVFSGAPFQPGGAVNTPIYLGGSKSPFGKKISPETQFLLEQLAPGLSKLRGVFPTDPRDAGSRIRRLGSIFAGQAVWPLTTRTRRNEMYRRLTELQTLQKYLADRGAKIPVPKSAPAATKGW